MEQRKMAMKRNGTEGEQIVWSLKIHRNERGRGARGSNASEGNARRQEREEGHVIEKQTRAVPKRESR